MNFEQALLRIWQQKKIPVIFHENRSGSKLLVRLPYRNNNRAWLSSFGKTAPEWNSLKKFWVLPKGWFNNLVEGCLDQFGSVYVIQPYREQEVCSPACQNAIGHECQCSCLGRNHGAGNDGSWFEVSETFSTRWGAKKLACRLMVRAKKAL